MGCCPQWVETALRKIDELWFDGRLAPTLGQISIVTSAPLPLRDAGMVVQHQNGRLTLFINARGLFGRLSPDEVYTSDGVRCRGTFECLLRTLMHESLHLYLILFHNGDATHSTLFRRLSRQLFNHRSPHHAMFPGFPQRPRWFVESLRPGAPVQVLNPRTGSVLSGVVLRHLRDGYSLVSTDEGRIVRLTGHLVRPAK